MGNKGMSIDECVSKAQEYISINGQCLLLFDMIGSKKYDSYETRNPLQKRLIAMTKDITEKFSDNFPLSNINCLVRYEKGFEFLLGDGSWAAIDDASVIPKIAEYQKEKYPDIPLRWGVAIDGFHEEGIKIVKLLP